MKTNSGQEDYNQIVMEFMARECKKFPSKPNEHIRSWWQLSRKLFRAVDSGEVAAKIPKNVRMVASDVRR